MSDFIVCLVSMSAQASLVILVVMILRKCLRILRVSGRYMILFWILPFFFLVFPWKITAPVGFWTHAPADYRMAGELTGTPGEVRWQNLTVGTGMMPDAGELGTASETGGNGTVSESAEPGTRAVYEASGPMAGGGEPEVPGAAAAPGREAAGRTAGQIQWAVSLFGLIWLMGTELVLVCNLIMTVRLRNRLVCSRCVRDNIYFADDIFTPMAVGIFRPRIYIPSGIGETYLEYVICHEQTHIRRKDPLIKAVFFLITCLHWFNPLVWYAYHVFCGDMEMACDEMTVRELGYERRDAYADALLALSSGKRMIFAMSPSFGEGHIKERLNNMFENKRTGRLLPVLVAVAGISLGLCFLTKAEVHGDGGQQSGSEEEANEESGVPEQAANNSPGQATAAIPENGTAECRNGAVSDAAVWHRDGYREAVVHLYMPKRLEEYGITAPPSRAEEDLDRMAQEALRELYDLTGTQIEECYYFVLGEEETDCCFGRTPEDLERDRIFLSRFHSGIGSIDIASARRVWYSDVDMYVLPEDYEKMTEEDRAVWFVTHSGLWNGSPAAEALRPYEWDGNIWHIIMEDGTAYEIDLDTEVESFGEIVGPYPDKYIRH